MLVKPVIFSSEFIDSEAKNALPEPYVQRAVAVRWRGVRDFRIESRAHSSDPPPRVSISRTARAATRLERHIRRLAVSLLIPHRCQKGLFFFDFSAASAA